MGHHRIHLGATLHDDGVDFAVWAPFAASVALLLETDFDRQEYPMTPDGNGCWTLDNIEATAGRMYRYKITTPDNRIFERNDPYARQLSNSENGWSVITVRDFEWESEGKFCNIPVSEAIIYELHIGTFHRPDASTSGTFASAIEKLDYIKDLGVNYIELMPVTSMNMSHGWGYAPECLFSVENSYGGRRGLLDFVKACHERGIGVILDIVFNHIAGDSSLWQFDGWSENNKGGIYFYNDERGDTPWGARPDFGRPEVRQFFLDNVAMWLTEYRIDGLRIDSTIYMRNTNGDNSDSTHDIPDAWSLLGEITSLAHKINPSALLIAEDNSTNSGIVSPVGEGGMGFDAQWEVGFPHVVRDGLGITNNSDQKPLDGVEWAITHSYTGQAFDRVVYSDSHDTAANGSSRINEAVTPGNAESVFARQRTLLASALALTSPGIPMILQGQEFMQSGSFNEWQMLEWSKTDQFSGMVLAHQHLSALRRNVYNNTAGLTGQFTKVFHRDDTNNVIGFQRSKKGGKGDDTLVILNFGKNRLKSYDISLHAASQWRVRFNSSWKGYSQDFHETPLGSVTVDANGVASIAMSEYSLIILSQD